MKKIADARLHQQEKVNAYFQAQSSYWKEVYVSEGVQAEIYRDRQATVLAWIDSLDLASGSQVLEIGCGAGLMAVALTQRGLRVHAIDSIEAMVELARRHALESGTSESLSVEVGDVYSLAFLVYWLYAGVPPHPYPDLPTGASQEDWIAAVRRSRTNPCRRRRRT